MRLTTARQAFVLAAAAAVPVTVGVHMHLEHLEAVEACEARPATQVVIAAPVATPVVVEDAPVVAEVVEPTVPDATPVDFAFVIDIEGPHVVLSTTVLEAWATDAPHYRGDDTNVFEGGNVWRSVASERLPDELRGQLGRKLVVYAASGRVCEATIGAPSLVGELTGSVGYLGEDDVELGETPNSVVAASIWDDARVSLVAPLEGGGDCEDAVWARDAELPAARVYRAASEDDLPSPVARRLLQRDPAMRAAGKDFAAHIAGMDDPAFTTRRLADRLRGVRWIEPTSGAELDVFVTDGEEFGYCGGFDPAWGAVGFDAEGNPAQSWFDTGGDDVIAVLDLDADGRAEVVTLEVFGSNKLVTLDDDGIEVYADLPQVPFYGCAC